MIHFFSQRSLSDEFRTLLAKELKVYEQEIFFGVIQGSRSPVLTSHDLLIVHLSKIDENLTKWITQLGSNSRNLEKTIIIFDNQIELDLLLTQLPHIIPCQLWILPNNLVHKHLKYLVKKALAAFKLIKSGIELVTISSSTGGPETLSKILSRLPKLQFQPILIVQHSIESTHLQLTEMLSKVCNLRVKLAQDYEYLLPSTVYVAPGDCHMTIKQRRPGLIQIRLNSDAPIEGCKPSASVLLESVANCCGPDSLSIILTGMGRDGASGVKTLGESNACVIAQEPATSVIPSMPMASIETGFVNEVLTPDQIVDKLSRI